MFLKQISVIYEIDNLRRPPTTATPLDVYHGRFENCYYNRLGGGRLKNWIGEKKSNDNNTR